MAYHLHILPVPTRLVPTRLLGQWRDMIQELYDIELKIPDKKKSKR